MKSLENFAIKNNQRGCFNVYKFQQLGLYLNIII